ncbi:MAG: hypothetical protein CVT48_02105 [Thermoplasmata archaeon HGW-Thermoplasmata-1]|nr:MAG: hypothetical protein CVT48_02105 [Thermoplasmata archaeon HGW-Thermoplasmata-1]
MNKILALLCTAAFGITMFSGCLGGNDIFLVTVTDAIKGYESGDVTVSIFTPDDGAVDVAITIQYNGENVYGGAVHAKDFVGIAQLGLNQFCVGNGVYTLEAKIGKKTAITTFSVEKWIDYISVNTLPKYTSEQDITLDIFWWPYGVVLSGNGTIGISRVFDNGSSIPVVTKHFSLQSVHFTTVVVGQDSLRGAGNYTISSVYFKNDWAKDNIVTKLHEQSNPDFEIGA